MEQHIFQWIKGGSMYGFEYIIEHMIGLCAVIGLLIVALLGIFGATIIITIGVKCIIAIIKGEDNNNGHGEQRL
jgi:hypothetical protein